MDNICDWGILMTPLLSVILVHMKVIKRAARAIQFRGNHNVRSALVRSGPLWSATTLRIALYSDFPVITVNQITE